MKTHAPLSVEKNQQQQQQKDVMARNLNNRERLHPLSLFQAVTSSW